MRCSSASQAVLRRRPLVLALALIGAVTLAQAAPEGGIVKAGQATIGGGGAYTRIDQTSTRAIIDWRSFSIGADERVQFVQPSASSATLNRVTGDQVSVLLGRMDANGQVFLINPNGIVIGQGAEINVGGLIASTANISDQNFMAGRLIFDEPGKPGAGINNAGVITAAEGGLVALVAPHVRNDGLIQARLGRVILGAADTFSIDLYGDGLISLAMADVPSRQLLDEQGHPVKSLITQAGEIDTAGGKTVLVTADTASKVLDSLINMSGTIKADAAIQEGGRILLLGKGGSVEVGGNLSAQGSGSGQTGGTIEVLGGQVTLAAGSNLNASGDAGGGTIHAGGAWQGGGNSYRSTATTVAAGARLDASAGQAGKGGEVVVWSDGNTSFAGAITARGGQASGDGGRVEVSGKRKLDFRGRVDAGSPKGHAGSLLLDPEYLDIGSVAAADINTTLQTGTSVTLQADQDIYLRAMIDGRGGTPGGDVIMNAGNNIDLYNHIVTNNGDVSLTATGGAITTSFPIYGNFGIYSGSGGISLSSASNLNLGALVTTGSLSATSTAGNVNVNSPIYETTGATTLTATVGNVNINQTVANATSGANLTVNAGQDINIATGAKIGPATGSTPTAGGRITMTAGNDINIGADIASYKGALAGANDAAIQLTATNGTVSLTNGIKVMSDKGAVTVTAGGNLNNGPYINGDLTSKDGNNVYLVNLAPTTGYFTTGALHLASTGGSVTINQIIPNTTGSVTIDAANAIQVNQRIYTKGGDITMNAGAGGITVTGTADPADPNASPKISTDTLGDMDAQGGNITLQASGDIRTSVLRSAATITLKSTAGSIIGGTVKESRWVNPNEPDPHFAVQSLGTPNQINLAGYAGISGFSGKANHFSAISSNGSIADVSATSSDTKLVAALDITNPSLPWGANLYAGRDIVLSLGINALGSSVTAKAGRDISIGSSTPNVEYNDGSYSSSVPVSVAASNLTLTAGTDPFAGLGALTIAGVSVPTWGGSYGAAYGNVTASGLIYLEGSGGMTVDASRDISLGNVRVSTSRNSYTDDPTSLPVNLTAGGNIGVSRLDTTGAVAITSANGNITLGATLGAHVDLLNMDFWNPSDLGLASLQITASTGNISMYEARATAGANRTGAISIAAPNGLVTFTGGAMGIETTASKSVTDGHGVVFTTSPIDVMPVARLPVVQHTNMGPIGPGPTLAGPGAPTVPGAPPPSTPGFTGGETLAEIYVPPPPPPPPPPPDPTPTSAPAATDTGGRVNDNTIVAISGSQGEAPPESQGGGGFTAGIDPTPTLTDQPQLVFLGGRGQAQEEDLGR